jgi:hypothetical protein
MWRHDLQETSYFMEENYNVLGIGQGLRASKTKKNSRREKTDMLKPFSVDYFTEQFHSRVKVHTIYKAIS